MSVSISESILSVSICPHSNLLQRKSQVDVVLLEHWQVEYLASTPLPDLAHDLGQALLVRGGEREPEVEPVLSLIVVYAGQSGCLGTCHHDLHTMPEHPDDPAASGLALDFTKGVTKYIKESRTKIEEKGRRGKKLGGWDKLKEPADIEAELAADHFMDLWRWSSNGTVENGHVLEQRVMTSGEGLEAQGWNDGGTWTVVT